MSRVLNNGLELSVDEKRALLADLLRKKAAQAKSAPLSFSQQRLWFLDQLEPGNPAYNLAWMRRVQGKLDQEALQATLNEIVRRHEILRTSFVSVAEQPVQMISADTRFPLSVIDLRQVANSKREAEAERLANNEVERPFDLSAGPLFRTNLVRIDEEEQILMLTMHHIVSDGWSMAILYRELSGLYQAFSQGQNSPLPELTVQYADFAQWQRKWLQGEELEQQLGYWRQQLGGTRASLELPLDHPRPPVRSFRGKRASVVISQQVTKGLRSLSQREGVTLFMTLLAAFQALLFRYTGEEDVWVGSPIANRNRAEIEDLIGFFVNTLVIRGDFSGRPTFRKLLARVKEAALGAYSHQDLPFEKLVEELHPERSMNRNPLFDVIFSMQNAPTATLEFSGLRVLPWGVESGRTRFDLEAHIWEKETELVCTFIYNCDLFEPQTIKRMLGNFETLLEEVVVHPEQRVSEVELLKPEERSQLLVDWNRTATDYPRRCLQQLFEEQMEHSSESIALVFQDQKVTYGELNRRANQLAHYLGKQGVGPEVMVGICMERSIEMIVGLLGILKAGGAYVSLDPSYPSQRLSFMLEDAGVTVLLTQASLRANLPVSQTRVIALDNEWDVVRSESEDNPVCNTSPENLAYLIYTSGSTGRAKGVCVAHRSVVRLVRETNYARLGPDEVFLQFAPLSFDASTFEIWGSLLNGARLVLMPPGLPSLAELGRAVKDSAVTTLWLTAGLFHQMVEMELESLRGLRQLIAGGDVLSVSHTEKAARELAGCRLFNGYGPTENTTFTCCYELQGGERFETTVPIGFPVSNTEVYILDRGMRPVPIGAAGELYVGGEGLARGYLNEAILTAEKLVPHPLSEKPGARLYRTGDLVRYLPGGKIEFFGRQDHQVKIRGFRIELGEIEAVLGQYPGVRETVVIVREDEPGDKRLVAYFVAQQGIAVATNDLRSFLKQRLPDHMSPSAFVELDSLPLTKNGKVDRRALPAPDQARLEFESAFVAPRTPVEEIVADIWAKVLRRELVGIHDNFFELGGHSLLATQVISRIRETFRVELPLRDLFEAPTVRGLAQRVEVARRTSEGVSAPPISPVSREGRIPLSFAQQRLWLLDQLEPGSYAYNVPMAVRIRGGLRPDALQQSLNALVARHESLRTTFVSLDGSPAQVVAEAGSFSMPLIDLTDLSDAVREAETGKLITQDAQRSFDLARGPLFCASLVRQEIEQHILLLNNHHIISDGWSAGILFEELAILYKAFSLGQPSPIGKLPIQYADYAVWQRDWLQGEVLQQQLSYWKEQLAGAPPLLELPLDRPRPAVQTHRGGRQRLLLGPSLTEGLRSLSQREGTTLFMLLLAALQLLLARLTGQDDIVVGAPIAGRTRAETDRVIGFFLNTVALRTKLSDEMTFRDLLSRVREIALEAYAHQEIPFERLIEELQPERSLGHTPLFNLFFNMLNFSLGGVELPGLTVEYLPSADIGSKFDLSVYVSEQKAGMALGVLYNADLFDEPSITRMLSHFQTLLEGIVANPEQSISAYALHTEAETYQDSIRAHSIRPANPFTTFEGEEIEQSISERFEQQVRKHPCKIAVKSKKHEWSYEELDDAANRIAHSILSMCKEGEERIALLFEHDAPMVAALLGTLKAGKTYVPLDPGYPLERLDYILRDSQAGAILTNNKNLALALELIGDGLLLINIDSLDPMAPIVDIKRTADASELAYILYTSGSTGRPKGVMQNHRNVLHFIRVYTNNLHISTDDRMTLLSSYSFDAAVMDIYGALLNGATLYPVDIREEGLAALSEWLVAQEITIYHSTPTVYRYFVNTLGGQPGFPRLRLVVLGGEEVTRRDVDLYKQYFSDDCLFVNGFGPTEATVGLQYFVDKQTKIPGQGVPVGYAVDNTEILLLNAAGKSAELYGEIAIKCAHLALGYWRNPEATEAAFLSNWQGGGSRVYRTGDIGRRLSDGNIRFEGRKDSQVKIRGFRVELGEIEFALSEHPKVRESVVSAQQNGSGETILVAYVVPLQAAVMTTAEMRQYLSEKLPDYMIPAAFIMMEALPLTPSRKVDRGALPTPERFRPELERTFVAPRTAVEQAVAGIWTEVLGLEKVGIHDNFFDLGGHSLLAVRLISEIEKQFGQKIPLVSLFQGATIQYLSDILQKDVRSMSWPTLVGIHPAGSRPALFCVSTPNVNALGYVALSRYLGPDQPVYGLQAQYPEDLDGEHSSAAVDRLAGQYLEALLAAQPHGPYQLIGMCRGAHIALEMALRLHEQGEKIALLGMLDTWVMENTYNKFLYVEYYFRRFRSLLHLSASEKLGFLKQKGLRTIRNLKASSSNSTSADSGNHNRNPLHIYFPGPDFVPRVYPGRISVFRVRKQPLNRIREASLGWAAIARDGVVIHVVPGKHGMNVLKEPNVQGLAEELQKCLLAEPDAPLHQDTFMLEDRFLNDSVAP